MDVTARLKEFDALRGEILAAYARESQRLSVAWAGVAALVGAGAVAKIPELTCFALALVASGWRDELKLMDGVTKIGAYIETVLEPQIPGLKWENTRRLIGDGNSTLPSLSRRLKIAALSRYGVFAVVSFFAFVLLVVLNPPSSPVRWAFIALVMALTGVNLWEAVSQAIRVPTRRQVWCQRFQSVAQDAPQQPPA